MNKNHSLNNIRKELMLAAEKLQKNNNWGNEFLSNDALIVTTDPKLEPNYKKKVKRKGVR